MIISASRRTDICAFYTRWFMNRVRAGYCCVPNPFNRRAVRFVSLDPEDVDAIVFWTRNARPLLPYLDELDRYGYAYYFQYTINGYPRKIEPACPGLEPAIRTFRELSERVGPRRVIWRYDPILITPETPVEYHLDRVAAIASALEGCADRLVVSIVDPYRSAGRRLEAVFGSRVAPYLGQIEEAALGELFQGIACIAREHGFAEVVSCAEAVELSAYGIEHGKCIDDELIERAFGVRVDGAKDKNQRPACGCVASIDIGMYDTCLYGCVYCYATHEPVDRRALMAAQDPHSPSLLGHYECQPPKMDGISAPGARPRRRSRCEHGA